MDTSCVDLAAVSALQDVIFDITDAMKVAETRKVPTVKTMDTQPEYTWAMRAPLLGMLLEFQTSLGLTSEVFSLAVNVLDRYASRRVINGRHYQLVGAVCFWIAAKFLDNKSRIPTVKEIEYLCAGAFSCTIICEMELHILSALEWDISTPTAVEFVDLEVGQLYADQKLVYADPAIYCALAKHICECSLFKRELLEVLPSRLAKVAVEVACSVVDVLCGAQLQFSSRYSCDASLFEELTSFIVAPVSHLDSRMSSYEPYDVIALFNRFLSECQTLNERHVPRAPQLWDSPQSTLSPSDCEFNSPATVASCEASPSGYPGIDAATFAKHEANFYHPMHNVL